MKIAIVLSIVAIAMSTVNSTTFNSITEDQEWIKFKTEFNKVYKNEKEELFRKKVFLENIKIIAKHNELYKKGLKPYELGINTYSDMTHQEFVAKMNGFKRIHGKKNHGESRYFSTAENEVPDVIDYRTMGYVTPVKDQGLCGSDWAFSTAGVIEGQIYRETKKLIPLSVQNLIDCSSLYGNNGCDGGTVSNAFLYVRKEGGINSESSYPYEAKEGTCRFNVKNNVAFNGTLIDFFLDEIALKIAVGSVGPISAAIDITQDDFKFYKSGVYYNANCSSTDVNHAVLVVGYGTDVLGQDYWIVKNSWGVEWGDYGYVLMARNKDNNCGIATSISVPTL